MKPYVLGCVLAAAFFPGLSAPDRPEQAEGEFEKRVTDYLELRKEAAGRAPKLKDKATPEEIERHEQALAAGIQAARAGARPGDLFGPVESYVRVAVRSELRGPKGRDARAKAGEENPSADGAQRVKVAVNALYPDAQPVSGMPASLLQKLPALPKELEYRFVGRDLILLDAKARLILDYLKDVAP